MPWRRTLKLEKNDMRQRLAALSPRERYLAVGGLVAIVSYGLYGLIYTPIAEEKIVLSQKIIAQQQALLQIKKISVEVAALRLNKLETVINEDQPSLMAVVDTSSAEMDIKPAIKRMIPDGADKATLWLEKISFDKLTDWLSVLETKQGITVEQISINREQGNDGRVNAKLLIKK